MAITLRLVKGSQLTFAEVDNNFKSLFYSSSLDGNTLKLFYYPGDTSQDVDLSSITGSGVDTGSLMVTGSVTGNILTFTKGDNSTFTLTVDTGSGGASVDTGSLLVTGSVSSNVLTFTKGDGTTFNLTVDTGSGGTSVDTGSLMVTGSVTSNVLTFTKGDGTTFNLTVDTGSIDTSSFVTNDQTGSFVTNNQTGSFLISASADLNTIYFTSSDNNTFSVVVDTGSGGGTNLSVKYNDFSIVGTTDTLNFNPPLLPTSEVGQININLVTSSFVQNDQTGSFVTNDQTSSFVVNSQTGSFLTSGSFNSGTSALTLYSDDTNYLVDLSSLAGGGGGILGIKYNGVVVTSSADMLNFNSPISASNTGDQIEITINTGSFVQNDQTSSFVTSSQTGSFLVSASNSGGDDYQDITFTQGDGTTFIIDATPNHVHERVINKETGTLLKGTPVYVSGSTGNASHVYAASASDASRMPAAYVLDRDIDSDQEGFGLVIGFINGVNTSQFEAGDNVYVGADGGYTNVRPTGSNIQVQKLGNVISVDASNGSGVITGAGRSNDVPNIQTGYLWVGNQDEVATAIATSSIQNVVSSSYASTASYSPNYVLNSATSSFVTNDQTGSFLISASADSNTIYFTASDASTFSVTVDTGSGGSGVTINNNTNNNVITATGTSNTLDGESSLTFDGGQSVGNLRVTHSAYIQGGTDGEQFVGGLHLNTASLYYNSIDLAKNGNSNHTDLVIVNIDNPATFSLAPNTGFEDGRVIIFRNWNTALGSTGELYVTTSMADTYFGLTNNNTYSSNFTMTGSTAATFLFLSGAYDTGIPDEPSYNLFMQISGDTITTFN